MSQYRDMLLKAREKFAFYARQHRDKRPTDPDAISATIVKAAANEDMVFEIDRVLGAPVLEVDYESMVARLQKSGAAILQNLTPKQAATIHMVMGVAGEAGELLDAIKRWVIYGKDLDLNNVVEELGDIEFFLAGIRQNLGVTREETLEANMAKLGVRYEGYSYSDEQAIARVDKEPELALGSGDGVAGD